MAIHMARSIGQEFTQPSLARSGKEDHRQELKQILMFAQSESKHQVILNVYETDLLQPGLFEDLDALAAHGEMLELFTKDEIENIINLKKFGDTSSNREKEKSREQYLEEIRQKCRENFKILLQLTPRSEFAQSRLRDCIHLVDQACLIQFGDWSRQGFEFIAAKYLREEQTTIPLDQPNEVIKQMIDMYYDSVEEAATHFHDTNHFIYIQAQHFENFCYIYREIYKNRMVELTQYKERFSRGLEGIKKTEENTSLIQERLSKESPKLVEGQRYLETKIEEYNNRKTIIGLKIKTIFKEEAELNFKFEEATRIHNSCERSLLEMIPILNDAIEGLLLIKKEDIDEIKSYKNPTPTLRTLMQAVCLVLRVPPVITREKENNFKPKEDYWIAALGPQVFGQRKIMQILSTIEPKTLDSEIMIQLEKLCDREELQPDKVQHACTAAFGINKWLRAVRDYYCVYKNSEGRRDKMILSDIQVQKFQKALEDKRQEIKQLEENLMSLRKKFAKKEEQIKQFQQKLEESYIMRSKASRLLNALISEKQKWSIFEAVAINKLKNVEGDSLMGAGMVCFLAPFTQSIREYLFMKWTKNIEISRVAITKDLNFNMQFGDPLLIKKWIDNQLSNDSYSIQNAIVLQLTQVQSILIDPQGQANKWLRNQIQDVKIINLETVKFMQEITLALKIGSVVLLENVGDQIPRKLYSLFKLSKMKYQIGKQKMIFIDNQVCNVHSDFKLYVTSLAKAPDFGSELSLICNFINFSVTPEAFTQQILALILEELEQELSETQKLYRRKTLEKLMELKDIEEDILETLRETQGEEEIIQEQSLIEKLQESAKLSKVVAQVLADINQNMKTLLTITALYKSAAVRAKQFFFLGNELTKLNPIYVFTHEWFLTIFTNKLKEVDHTKTIVQKAEWISQTFTRQFYEKVCQTLFEKDKSLFSFLLAYRVLEIECRFDMRLMEFFIKGPLQETKEVIDVAKMADASTDFRKTELSFEAETKILMRRKKAVPWITTSQWVALDKLSQIAPFNTPNEQTKCRNLSEHIEKHPDEWLKWLNGMVTSDYTMHDKVQIEGEEEKNTANTVQQKKEKEIANDTGSDASSKDSPDRQSEDAVVQIANQQFLLKRVDTQRMLGLLIPGGYEESNFVQEQIIARKNKAVNDNLMARLAAGQRKLLEMPKKQSMSSDMSLDQIFAHDLDSDNNNTDLEQISEEDNVNEGLQKTTVEEDIQIAKTIMDGVAEYTEFFVESSINKKKRFRIQTILTSDLSRLCIMRCFHPEKIMVEIRSFITKFLGPRYIDPPNFDWIPILNSSKKSIPNLIMVGPNVNAYVELKFIITNFLEFKEKTIIYQPVGSLPNEVVAQLIISAACQGKWLLLDNLHLQYQLLPNIQKFFEVMKEMHHEIIKRIKREAYKYLEVQYKNNKTQARKTAVRKKESTSSIETSNDKKSKNKKVTRDNSYFDDDEEEIDFNSKKLPETKYASIDQVRSRIRSEKRQQRTYILKKLAQIQEDQRDENNKNDKGRELTPEDKAFKDLKFPESFAFPIHKDFRLWLSTIITPDFPTSFARRCNKVTLELPTAIRQNSMKTLSQSTEFFDKLKGSHVQTPFRRLLFSTTIMHAVINSREKFGSFGWTQPYQFSPNDVNMSLKILSSICGQVSNNDKIPIDLLQYCVGQLGYGGNVINNEDKLTLSSIVKTFIHDRVYTQLKDINLFERVYKDGSEIKEFYDLTGLQYDPMRSVSIDGLKGFTEMEYGREKSYIMPKEISSLTQAIEYVRDNFPIIDRPQIFGLHPCATIKQVKDAGLDIMYRVYVYQFVIKRPKRPMFGNNKFDEKYLLIYEEQRARLIKLQYEIPAPFQLKEYVNLSVAREMGMNAFIQKEIGLYNILIAAIHENLDETLAAIDGIKQSNDRTDNTFECLQLQRTPREWQKFSYPGNPSLPIYILNLKRRVKYIRDLLEEANKSLKKLSYGTQKFKIKNFWLPGFFDQRNFLTTLMQIISRKKKLSIETAKLNFRFIKQNEPLQKYSYCEENDIYYLHGIWLYGAHWNKEYATLVDMPSQSYQGQELPTLEVKVLFTQVVDFSQRSKIIQKVKTPSMDLMNPRQMLETGFLDNMDQNATLSNITDAPDYHYLCPLYVNFQKNRILNIPSEANGQLIVLVPIPIKHRKPEFWVKRSICMLCYSEDIIDD